MSNEAIVIARQSEAVVGATSDIQNAIEKARDGNAGPSAAGRIGDNGEAISEFSVTPLPPDFDFVASMTPKDKVQYIRAALARSEDEAIELVAPALQAYGSAGAMVEAYLPMILEVKKHFCHVGRPRINAATGKSNPTWAQICEHQFGLGVRRVQQILATLRQPRLAGSTATRNPRIDRKQFERATRVAAPATSLAQAVIREGLEAKFPEALDILKLADFPVPVTRPATATPDLSTEPDWKGIVTGLVRTLQEHADRLPTEVIKVLKSTEGLLDEKGEPETLAHSETTTAQRSAGKKRSKATTRNSTLTGQAEDNRERGAEVQETFSWPDEDWSPAVKAADEASDVERKGSDASPVTPESQPAEGDGSRMKAPDAEETARGCAGDGAGPTPGQPRSVKSFTDEDRGTVKSGYFCKYNGDDCEIRQVWDDGTVILVQASDGRAVSDNHIPIAELRYITAAEGRAS